MLSPEEFETLKASAIRAGATQVALIRAEEILVRDDLARLCREGCDYYGQGGSCPPHVAGPDGFRKMMEHFRQALVVRMEVPAENLYSSASRDLFRLLHEVVAAIEKSAGNLEYIRTQAFAGGPCKQIFCLEQPDCSRIAGGACRFPDIARPSMSGFGIDVAKLSQKAGWGDTLAQSPDGMASLYGLVLIGQLG